MVTLHGMWEAWKRIARVIGDFQARLILTLLYILLIMPLGFMVRLFSDPLRLRRSAPGSASSTYWISRLPEDTPTDNPLDEARRQY